MPRKSCLYTILKYSVLARFSAHTNRISCKYLAQYPRLQFCGLIYIQLLHLWCVLQYEPVPSRILQFSARPTYNGPTYRNMRFIASISSLRHHFVIISQILPSLHQSSVSMAFSITVLHKPGDQCFIASWQAIKAELGTRSFFSGSLSALRSFFYQGSLSLLRLFCRFSGSLISQSL